MLLAAALLVTAILFGGMALFSFGFAAFLFTALPVDVARLTIRKAFPHFYLFVICTAALSAVLIGQRDLYATGVMIGLLLPRYQLVRSSCQQSIKPQI